MTRSITKYLFKDENASTETFKIHKRFWPAGTKFPPHWHDYLELEIIISGSVKHIYNNISYECKKGSAHIISYYDFHELIATTDVTFFCIQFNNAFLDSQIIEHLASNSILCEFDEAELREIKEQINILLDEQDNTRIFRSQYIKTIVTGILLKMIRKTALQQKKSTPLPIQPIIAYIANHYLDKITIDEIAHKFAFSSNYLGKLFKSQTGYKFNEYINLLRLRHACNLLQKNNLPIKEIAFMSGYQSVEYFLYLFKKNMQMTPSEYRQLFSSSDNTSSDTK